MKKTIYVFNDGEFKRKDNTIYFDGAEGKKYIPVEDVKEIIIFGEVSLNKRFLEYLSQKEIILHFLNNYGYYVGSFYPREHLNSGYMILRQAEYYLDYNKRMNISRLIVQGAVSNMLEVLKYYNNRGKEVNEQIEKINALADNIEECDKTEVLMALEGNIREIYYSAFNTIIDKKDFVFEGRNRRPPQDRINALISFGNTLVYTAVLSEIYKTHLDPRIGFLHTTNFRRFTLNLDIAEIFKPILVDRLIFSLLAKNMLRQTHFEKKLNGILMNEKGRKIFVENWEEKLRTTIKHRDLGREVSYRRIIRMELYKLEKHLMGEKDFTPFVSRW
ncbi:CRISPR-associated protein Cas1 [Candidatus Syntrophocurvum alkaliphilum]|uniref:CRISPR-associated endonuclease Cas1 n=1 Tax=Candidatus Syntrophocurvum alkaliphilum TaxID=2293317 RepID=A0A6I6DAF8_9FIRM|nr:type I-B CRISPR-associated endonuclease Cas1b [Candidatus Syntrophocurvum alkaliphilum]QGT99798.1 CRISPR-associated protein Cas1 [Candidatus Syntrophocurvum alkaliphilum]